MIVVTGFEPFGKYSENPSGEVAKALNSERIMNQEIRGIVLPVAYRRAKRIIEETLMKYRPLIFLGIGLAPGSPSIKLERIAINIMDFKKPDNDGEKPVDIPIYPDGPLAYMATIPIRRVCKVLRERGIPAVISYNAGTFLCNFVFYTTLYNVDKLQLKTKVGFVHIPCDVGQVAKGDQMLPSMPICLVIKAIRTIIRATLEEINGEASYSSNV